MWVCVVIRSVRPAGQLSVYGKNFNVGIFLDFMNMTSDFPLWWYSLSFTHLYHFQWPWLYFKVTVVSHSFNWICSVLIRLSWLRQVDHEYNTIFEFRTRSREITDTFLDWLNFNIELFSETVNARSFKVCLINTLLGVHITSFDYLDFKVRCVRNINCKLRVLDSCPL